MAIDKRILKTKTNIKNAYMRLTVENRHEKITVSQIAEKANVNRSTFYLHYADTAAVATDIEKEISAKITNYLDCFDIADVYGSACRIFTNLSSALDEDALLSNYLLILSKEPANILETIFTEKTTAAMLRAYPYLTESELVFPVTFVSAGVISTYLKWTQADKTQMPMESLIKELSFIINMIIKSLAERKSA